MRLLKFFLWITLLTCISWGTVIFLGPTLIDRAVNAYFGDAVKIQRLDVSPVYCSTGSHYRVKSEGQFYDCRIKGKFRIKGIKSTNPVAVGDQVVFTIQPEKAEKVGVITEIEPRQNYIVRKSVNLSKQIHIIASNIDQVFLIITLKTPLTFPAFIDRFLVTAKAYEIKTVLVFNKIDLYNPQELIEMRLLKSVYEQIGYDCHEVVATDLNTLDQIKRAMTQSIVLRQTMK